MFPTMRGDVILDVYVPSVICCHAAVLISDGKTLQNITFSDKSIKLSGKRAKQASKQRNAIQRHSTQSKASKASPRFPVGSERGRGSPTKRSTCFLRTCGSMPSARANQVDLFLLLAAALPDDPKKCPWAGRRISHVSANLMVP